MKSIIQHLILSFIPTMKRRKKNVFNNDEKKNNKPTTQIENLIELIVNEKIEGEKKMEKRRWNFVNEVK